MDKSIDIISINKEHKYAQNYYTVRRRFDFDAVIRFEDTRFPTWEPS